GQRSTTGAVAASDPQQPVAGTTRPSRPATSEPVPSLSTREVDNSPCQLDAWRNELPQQSAGKRVRVSAGSRAGECGADSCGSSSRARCAPRTQEPAGTSSRSRDLDLRI